MKIFKFNCYNFHIILAIFIICFSTLAGAEEEKTLYEEFLEKKNYAEKETPLMQAFLEKRAVSSNLTKQDVSTTVIIKKETEKANKHLIKNNLPNSLEELFNLIAKNPSDLDLNFKYATLATQLKKYDEAMAAYERMLMVNSNLPRIKLEMGMLNLKQNRPKEAKKLFLEVLQTNPPLVVQKNIKRMILEAENGIKKHFVSGSVSVGYQADTNANSAPGSGAIDLFGTSINLSGSSLSDSDDRIFMSANLNHTYKLLTEKSHELINSFSVYKTRQSSLKNINTTVFSVSTMPVFQLTNKVKSGFKITYLDINLNEYDYLRQKSLEGFLEVLANNKLKLKTSWKHDNLRYRNSPLVTTYELKNGRANEYSLMTTYLLSKTSSLMVSSSFRHEVAQVAYNSNRSQKLNVAYMKMLPWNISLNINTTLKRSKYKDVDSFVNPDLIRADYEGSYKITISKRLRKNFSINASYSYKDVRSNIQNYEYENESFSVSLSYYF